jgi:hypothetical protein
VFTNDVTHWSWYYVLGVLNASLGLAALADWTEAQATRRLALARRIAWGGLFAAATAAALALGIARAWIRYDNPDAIHGKNVFIIHEKRAPRRWQGQVADWHAGLPFGTVAAAGRRADQRFQV